MTKREWTQEIRWRLERMHRFARMNLGLLDRRAFALGIDEFRKSDTFIVSYPRSGNTWVRFLLANLMYEGLVTFRNLNDFVPGIYTSKAIIDRTPGRRFIKSHQPVNEHFPKVVYIARDYRDVLVSYFQFQVVRGQFKGDFPDFIRSPAVSKLFGHWCDHVRCALEFRQSHPDRIMFVTFERLTVDALEVTRRLAGFCAVEPVKTFEEVVAASCFDNLRRLEEIHGNYFENSERRFFRSGRTGEWRERFDQADLAWLLADRDNADMLRQLGESED